MTGLPPAATEGDRVDERAARMDRRWRGKGRFDDPPNLRPLMGNRDDDTLDDDGALAGAAAGDDELDRPVDPVPGEPDHPDDSAGEIP